MVNKTQNLSAQYEELAHFFLEDEVSTWKILKPDHRKLFITACLPKYRKKFTSRKEMIDNSKFIEEVYGSEGKKQPEDIKSVFNYIRRKIEPKIKEIDKELIKKTIDTDRKEERKKWTWEEINNFLEIELFPIWLKEHPEYSSEPSSNNNSWKLIWNNVVSEKIKVATPPCATMAVGWKGKKPEQLPEYHWGDEIRYQMELKKYGYLILLEKFASTKEIYCLAPSYLVREVKVESGIAVFPNIPDLKYLTIEPDGVGVEEVIVIVSPEKPSLSWLPNLKQEPLLLRESDLQELSQFLENNSDLEILGTKYLIKP